jgi:RNA polymerase sigma-70 factor (ECF subfamily)
LKASSGFGSVLLSVAVLASHGAARLGAQTFRGTVIDDSTRRPLESVTRLLLDGDGREVGKSPVCSDTAGRFVLHAGSTGRFMLRANRIGYAPLTNELVEFVGGAVVTLNLAMSAVQQKLGTIVVTEQRRYNRFELYSATGFECRRPASVPISACCKRSSNALSAVASSRSGPGRISRRCVQMNRGALPADPWRLSLRAVHSRRGSDQTLPAVMVTNDAPDVLTTARRVTGEDAAQTANALDLALIRRMCEGDHAALGALYDRWSHRVHAIAQMLLRDREDAEDVVQETFWQTWRDAEKCDGSRGTVGSWILTIARSRALDKRRARGRNREQHDSDVLDSFAGSSDPAGDAGFSETRRLVRSALQSLPEEQRATLELSYFGGMSQTEIAEKTGAPLGTVKTRMRLAMARLRERLEVLR